VPNEVGWAAEAIVCGAIPRFLRSTASPPVRRGKARSTHRHAHALYCPCTECVLQYGTQAPLVQPVPTQL